MGTTKLLKFLIGISITIDLSILWFNNFIGYTYTMITIVGLIVLNYSLKTIKEKNPILGAIFIFIGLLVLILIYRLNSINKETVYCISLLIYSINQLCVGVNYII